MNIDSLVAEKVMGWSYPPGVAPWVDNSDWCPSTDIAAAWQVMEKLKPYVFSVERMQNRQWYAVFSIPHGQGQFELAGDGYGQTGPEAICRAALNTVGIKLPE